MTGFKLMGDPHLGRQFRTGVPLHRVGDREAMVWAQFERELMECDTQFHINMGDLFDKFVVPPEVVLRAAAIYRRAAYQNLATSYVVIRGNHDVSRDSAKRSSFEIFEALVNEMPNIWVVEEIPLFLDPINAWVVPFNPFEPVGTTLDRLELDEGQTVFMHHDFQDWGGDQVIPTQRMAGLKVINGHDHVARTETRHGVEVAMTGSMQPYSHAEDRTGEWYITCRLHEIPDDCTNLNVRVLLEEGEVLPDDLDCLSLVAKRVTSDEVLEVDTEEFDGVDIGASLSEVVHPDVREEIMEKFNDS